ncbi:MAG TPA: ATP-binding protein [Pseudobacteroides sp.]|uniref:ATP-binding protein n=1 Tax=Pseudobacteroides sp. TaxID=1968840 RepID=UPI002F9305DA
MINNSESATVFKKNDSRRLTIGVLKSQMVDQRDILMIEGLKQAAKENDVNLIVYCGGMIVSPDDIDLQAIAIFDFVDKNRLDGLIIWTGNINWHASTEFTERFVKKYNFLPVVSLEIKVDGITSILWDDYNGMRDALIHLIEVHQCKRIGFVMGASPSSLYQRYEAYIDTLTEYGIPIDMNLIIDQETLYNYQNIIEYAVYMDRSIFVEQGIIENFEKSIKVIENLWEADIEALACCNDLNARTVYRVLKARNLPIIPIVGFDDDPESRAVSPALTAVRPPIYEMGKRAVEVIIAKIKGLQTLETETLPCSLIVRQSCGCPCSSVRKEEIYKERLQQYLVQSKSKNVNAAKFEKIINSAVAVPDDIDANWAEKLLKALLNDVHGESGAFTDYIKNFFVYTQNKKYIEFFQDIILVMHIFVDFLIMDQGLEHYTAKKLLQQGTALIADMRVRLEMSKRLKQTQRHFDIVTFSQRISNTYDINEILGKIADGLRYLGVSSCYMSIYENGDVSTDKARLLLAYNENGYIKISQDCIYPSERLVPEDVLTYDKSFNFVLRPLHFRKRNIGFILLKDTLEDSSEYKRLTEVISNTMYSVILVDELKSKAQELIKINSELESAYSLLKDNQQKLISSEKMASLGRLTAGIAHEMNTPLAAVSTSLKEFEELLNEYYQSIGNPNVLPEDHRLIAKDMMKCLRLAIQAAEKSAGFIKGIKSQTSNMNTSNSQVFNAADVTKDALSILDFAIRKGNCKLSTNFDNSIKIYGDPNRFVQMATNLVINSIDACKPDGGNISIVIENYGDGIAKITFQDTGCGIPDEIKERIFDPMFTTKPFGEGTGLGLSIVHDLVNEFNGRINVESQKGLTSFFIFLPIKQE